MNRLRDSTRLSSVKMKKRQECAAASSLNVDEVVAALVALHSQLTGPPLLHLGPRRSLVVDGVHLAHYGLDACAT